MLHRCPRPQDGLNPSSSHGRAGQNISQRRRIHTRPYRSEGHQPTRTSPVPNSRAADSVRSGKDDAPTPKNERFRSSQPCVGGAGGTRTHRRRIMSSFEDLGGPCRSTLTLGVFPGQILFGASALLGPCQSFPVLVSNLRPERVPDGHAHPVHGPSPEPRSGPTAGKPDTSVVTREIPCGRGARAELGPAGNEDQRPSSGGDLEPRPQRTPLPTARRLSPGRKRLRAAWPSSSVANRVGGAVESGASKAVAGTVPTCSGKHTDGTAVDIRITMPKVTTSRLTWKFERRKEPTWKSIYNRSCILIYAAVCMRRPS